MSVLDSIRKVFRRPYRSVGPAAAAVLIDDGAVLLDVREAGEFRAGRAPRARHIPLGSLPTRMGELPPSRRVVTVCRSGARSARAASLLAGSGREVVNLSGGMRAWQRAGLPVVGRGGRPGRVT